MANTLIECKKLSAWYELGKNRVLRDISLEIPRQSFTIFCGPNGSGKTTLFRVIRGLASLFGIKTEGEVLVNDTDILGLTLESLSEKIGMVFQRPSTQLFNLVVSDEVRSGPLLRGFPWQKVLSREEEALKLLDIAHLRNRPVLQLSGGEQQKTVTAAIMALKPDVLLLDEPSSFMDPLSRENLLEILKKLNSYGTTILMTSHVLEEELAYADNLVVLDKGSIKLHGNPKKIVFTQDMDQVFPPRGFLKVSKELWAKKLVKDKIIDPNNVALESPQPVFPNQMKKVRHRVVQLPIIRFQNVSVSYPGGPRALNDISLNIPKNTITTILGPNGCGKTTIARTCLRFLKPISGRVLVGEENLQRIRRNQIPKLIGYVTQDPGEMLFCESVFDEVMFAVSNLELDRPLERVRSALERVGMNSLSDIPTETLSLGQQRRLTIAVALAMGPPSVMFMDEPELALDPQSLETLLRIFEELVKEVTIVVLTHDVDTFVPFSDHIIILDQGKLVAEGNPEQVFDVDAVKNKLKPPKLWELWKSHPRARTWCELAKELVKDHES